MNALLSKVKWLFTEIKTHWNTPADGKYVPYKEYRDVVFAVGSNYAGSKVLEYIGFASSCYLIMHHYKLPYLTFSVMSILNMPLGYISALMWWFVCDNLGFLPKKTERKFYFVYVLMMLFGISTILFDYSRLFNPTGPFIAYLNGLEGMNATACFKTFGTHFLYTGWVGARNIFWRKKLLPKFGRYKYSLYFDVALQFNKSISKNGRSILLPSAFCLISSGRTSCRLENCLKDIEWIIDAVQGKKLCLIKVVA